MERHVIEINSIVEGIFHKEVGNQILVHFHLIYGKPCYVKNKLPKPHIEYDARYDKRKAALAK